MKNAKSMLLAGAAILLGGSALSAPAAAQTADVLGLKDGAVGISKNKQYEALVPAEIRAEVEAKEQAIISGEIVVNADVK